LVVNWSLFWRVSEKVDGEDFIIHTAYGQSHLFGIPFSVGPENTPPKPQSSLSSLSPLTPLLPFLQKQSLSYAGVGSTSVLASAVLMQSSAKNVFSAAVAASTTSSVALKLPPTVPKEKEPSPSLASPATSVATPSKGLDITPPSLQWSTSTQSPLSLSLDFPRVVNFKGKFFFLLIYYLLH
jgi:hypothetical protein